jgi:hypothetical protein
MEGHCPAEVAAKFDPIGILPPVPERFSSLPEKIPQKC